MVQKGKKPKPALKKPAAVQSAPPKKVPSAKVPSTKVPSAKVPSAMVPSAKEVQCDTHKTTPPVKGAKEAAAWNSSVDDRTRSFRSTQSTLSHGRSTPFCPSCQLVEAMAVSVVLCARRSLIDADVMHEFRLLCEDFGNCCGGPSSYDEEYETDSTTGVFWDPQFDPDIVDFDELPNVESAATGVNPTDEIKMD